MPNQRQSHAERGDEADRKTQAGPLPGATGTFEGLASLAWPLAFAASMSRAAASSLDAMALAFAQGQAEPTSPESEWATPDWSNSGATTHTSSESAAAIRAQASRPGA